MQRKAFFQHENIQHLTENMEQFGLYEGRTDGLDPSL